MSRFLALFFIVLCLAVALNAPLFAQDQSEQITITTYYPSPFGVYRTLRLFPLTTAPTCSTADHAGTMYYDSAGTLNVCNGSAWRSVGGATDGDSIMYLSSALGNAVACPAGWTGHGQQAYQYITWSYDWSGTLTMGFSTGNVRTCTNDTVACRVMYFKTSAATPTACPAGWTGAAGLGSDGYNNIRTCFNCS